MTESTKNIAAARKSECSKRASYFESRLRFFGKTNWITVIVPSLLGVIAGSALFSPSNTIWLGVGALIAALLTAIHKGLDCEAHQEECRRLVQAYRGLEMRYRTISEIEVEDSQATLVELEDSLALLKESQLATTSAQWFKSRSNDA
jgi:hypothetical protein